MSILITPHIKWLRLGRSANTTRDRERVLLHADKRLPHGLDEVEVGELTEYLGNSRWADRTRRTYDMHLRGFYGWAVKCGKLSHDPMAHIITTPSRRSLPNPCTDDELAHILDHAPNRQWKLCFLLCAYAGLRAFEVGNLRREDVTEDRIRIRCGKGGKAGAVETHPDIWQAMKDLPRGYVMPNKRGLPSTGTQMSARAYGVFHRMGLPDLHLHRLRHWHGTSLLVAGADLETVRQCMRHENIATTVGYTLIASTARREAVHRLPVMGARAGQ